MDLHRVPVDLSGPNQRLTPAGTAPIGISAGPSRPQPENMRGSGEETGSACGSRKGSALWLGSKRWMRVRGGGMEPGAQPAAHTPHVGGRE
eukprot:3452950-Rhodomonas_salina.1